MKQVFLLHGTGGSDTDYFWFADTKKHLEENGYTVWWPLLPTTDKPQLAETLGSLMANAPALNSETLIIGHSSACPVILHWLEQQDATVAHTLLVAGYYQDIGGNSAQMLPEVFDWQKIATKSQKITMINSDNDPWGCTALNASAAARALGADLLVLEKEGHMGSVKFEQPYREFKLLKELAGSTS